MLVRGCSLIARSEFDHGQLDAQSPASYHASDGPRPARPEAPDPRSGEGPATRVTGPSG